MPRLVTYNVRRCLGMDGVLSPKRIAAVLADCEPDLIALQELDVGRARTRSIDQASEIARELGMQLHFHPVFKIEAELYGDAILTLAPSELVKAAALPGNPRRPHREPRGAVWVRIDLGHAYLNLINTHLGLGRLERVLQARALLGPEWLADRHCAGPLLLAGDFNSVRRSPAYRLLASVLRDAHVEGSGRPRPTFPAYLPVLRIDHVFVNDLIGVLGASVVRTELSEVASDHLPLLVDFELE